MARISPISSPTLRLVVILNCTGSFVQRALCKRVDSSRMWATYPPRFLQNASNATPTPLPPAEENLPWWAPLGRPVVALRPEPPLPEPSYREAEVTLHPWTGPQKSAMGGGEKTCVEDCS